MEGLVWGMKGLLRGRVLLTGSSWARRVSPVGTVMRRESPHPPSSQVYYLGEGEASRRWLQQEQNTKAKLCLSHLKAVASHVLARHPATMPLLWDDMLRGVPEDQLTGQLSRRDP